ncbi:hypothetical protein O3P69_015197 [Scylla paramamosain]|uniref:Uncharacterized protein n=1 Tax=Scylla paramamosain TaxID=85552 RepID=A0AAW0T484_SCYPA
MSVRTCSRAPSTPSRPPPPPSPIYLNRSPSPSPASHSRVRRQLRLSVGLLAGSVGVLLLPLQVLLLASAHPYHTASLVTTDERFYSEKEKVALKRLVYI